MNISDYTDQKLIYVIILCVIAVNLSVWVFTDNSPASGNPYNSYTLQANAWLEGRLDLGKNYTHLELTEFDGKYYVSFPPFPSVVLLPFAVFLGENTPDHFIAWFFACLSAVLAYKLALRLSENKARSALYSILLCVGSNYAFLTNNGFVWFLAQNMAFFFTLASFYCAASQKSALSLLCLCCAMGCRPFQGVYLPLVLYINYKNHAESGLFGFMKKTAVQALPAILLGSFFMWLNYARFGNIFEFGHNYLPEFIEAPLGQFHPRYLSENLRRLVRLPEIIDGAIRFQKFDGTAFWLVSPIFVSYAALFVRNFILIIKKAFRRENTGENQCPDKVIFFSVPVLIAAHFILLCLHRTMGGWHFGNRYTVDALPALFLGLALLKFPGGQKPKTAFFITNVIFLVWGCAVNIIGTVMLYTGKL